MDKIHEEFERWLKSVGNLTMKEGDGEHSFQHTRFAFEAWKASRASLCVKLPENCKGMALTVDEFRAQLDTAGVGHE